ncbi:MFS transporter [Tropicimonas sp. TH_r6]|uniref:MFS transporter n=1 Tax=Tropicimonas sp. TH_r6 TaxID=3082085 RepID=UPI00295569D5|nr:MFS transporter [Tropicimonas sp. TH_r6]MDV7145674.1 MFS transporter [Tropicimonas sp. TH_r6]
MESKSYSLQALLLSMGSIHLATAALGTLVALQIAAIGGSAELASLVAASYSLGFLLGCFFTYKPLANVGYVRAFAAAAALCAMFALLMSRTDSAGAWVIARFVIGMATAGLYSVGEAWINDSASASSRGRVLAVYSTVLGVASVVSQAVVALVSEDISGGFVFMAAAFCFAIVVLALTNMKQPVAKGHATVRLLPVFRYSPTAFIGTLVTGIVVTVFLSIMPFQASTVGISSTTITVSIAMAYAGRIVFQYPLGRISDHMDRRILIVGTGLVASVTLLMIALFVTGDGSALQGDPGIGLRLAATGISIVLGGTLLPLYAILMAHAMDRTDPVYVPSTAITLLFVYTVGGVLGPVLVAVISALFGDGLIDWVMFYLLLGFSLFAAWRIRQRTPVPSAEQAVMAPATATSVETLASQKRAHSVQSG